MPQYYNLDEAFNRGWQEPDRLALVREQLAGARQGRELAVKADARAGRAERVTRGEFAGKYGAVPEEFTYPEGETFSEGMDTPAMYDYKKKQQEIQDRQDRLAESLAGVRDRTRIGPGGKSSDAAIIGSLGRSLNTLAAIRFQRPLTEEESSIYDWQMRSYRDLTDKEYVPDPQGKTDPAATSTDGKTSWWNNPAGSFRTGMGNWLAGKGPAPWKSSELGGQMAGSITPAAQAAGVKKMQVQFPGGVVKGMADTPANRAQAKKDGLKVLN
jgi:hypothetical protein